jgi:hypothetical protein
MPTVDVALTEGVQELCRTEATRRGSSDHGEAVRAAFFNEDGSRSDREHFTARQAVIVVLRRDCLAVRWLRAADQAEKVAALTRALAIALALPNDRPVPAAEARHRTIALWALRRRIQQEKLGAEISRECRELGAQIGFPDSALGVTWFTPSRANRALVGLRSVVSGLRLAAIRTVLGRLRLFGRPGPWVLDPDPWTPDPEPPSPEERAVLANLLTVYTTQFGSYTTLLWQVPALSLTAQAFLLTIVLTAGNGHFAKLIAAALSIVIALASTRLMHDQRGHAMNHGELALRISRQLGLGRTLGNLEIEDAEPAGADAETVWASWDHRIYHTWTSALYLFLVVDVVAFVPTVVELFQDHHH